MSCWTKEELENMLEDVVNELDLSDQMLDVHGPLGTSPAELVRLVLEQKDRQIAMLKRGFVSDEAKDDVSLDDVLSWADGIMGALGTEHAGKVTDEEARIAWAITMISPQHGPLLGETSLVINRLVTKDLSAPMTVFIEPDADGYIARAPDVASLFGFGDTRFEALDALKHEIESLYMDLMTDGEFTKEWLGIKYFLAGIVVKDEE